MVLTVGVDSYVTLEEANEYVSSYYTSSDTGYVFWNNLTDADRQVLLRKALSNLEKLSYVGRKAIGSQELSFPRYPTNIVPQKVKRAQIVEALFLCDPVNQNEVAQGNIFKQKGVKEYSLGNLSETFFSASIQPVSAESISLLSEWLSGGYKIC